MLTPPSASVCCRRRRSVLEFDAEGKLLVSELGRPGQAMSGRSRRAASPWTRRATSGSPPPGSNRRPGTPARGRGERRLRGATAPPPARRARAGRGTRAGGGRACHRRRRAPPGDAHVLKFSRDGQFLLQIGTPGKMDGPDSQTTLNRPAAVAVRRRGQRGVRRRQRQPPHRRLRRRHRRLQAALVRVRREDRRRGGRAVRSGAPRREIVPRRHLHRDRAGRHGLRLRSQQQPHPGVPTRRQVRQGRRRRRRTRWARRSTGQLRRRLSRTARCGTSRSRTTRSSATSSSPTATTRRCASCSATRSPRSAASAAAAAIRDSSSRSAASPSDAQGNVYTGEQHHGKRVQKFVARRK